MWHGESMTQWSNCLRFSILKMATENFTNLMKHDQNVGADCECGSRTRAILLRNSCVKFCVFLFSFHFITMRFADIVLLRPTFSPVSTKTARCYTFNQAVDGGERDEIHLDALFARNDLKQQHKRMDAADGYRIENTLCDINATAHRRWWIS